MQIIDLWVQGKLDGKLFRGIGIGLQAIEVDCSVLSEKELIELIGDLTADEAARYLKINVASIRRLRDAGYLEAVSRRNPDTNHLKQYVTKHSILEFERQYITLGQLAENRIERPIHLARKLDREGLAPVSCSAGHVRVYSKDAMNRWIGKNV